MNLVVISQQVVSPVVVPKFHLKLAHKGLPCLSQHQQILLDIVDKVLLDIATISSYCHLETIGTLDQRDLKTAVNLGLGWQAFKQQQDLRQNRHSSTGIGQDLGYHHGHYQHRLTSSQ